MQMQVQSKATQMQMKMLHATEENERYNISNWEMWNMKHEIWKECADMNIVCGPAQVGCAKWSECARLTNANILAKLQTANCKLPKWNAKYQQLISGIRNLTRECEFQTRNG